MPRRKAVPKTGGWTKLHPPDAVSPADMWDAVSAEWAKKKGDYQPDLEVNVEDEHAQKTHRPHVTLEPCTCYCRCGGRGIAGLCALCRRGYHHTCGKACGSYAEVLVEYGGVRERLPFIPERRACDGGRAPGGDRRL